MSKQDGRASVPEWYRRFLEWLYGVRIVAILDWIGGKHDWDIARYGYIAAALIMAGRLFFYLPWVLIALPVSTFVILYALVPKPIKKLYWKIIE